MKFWLTYLLTFLLTIGVLAFDLNAELGIAGGVPYIAVVLMSLRLPGYRTAFILAIVTSLLTVYGYYQSPIGGEQWKILTNRALALFAIWVTAIVCYFRKKSERELFLRNQTIESVDQGILITDPQQEDNPIIYCNQAFEKMTGYSLKEIFGKNCRFLNSRDRDQEGLKILREAIRLEKDCRVTLKNYKKDGGFFWNELALTCLRNDQGQTTHFVGIVHDVTEIQDANMRLEKAVQNRTQELEKTVVELKEAQKKSERATRSILNLAQDAEMAKKKAEDAVEELQLSNQELEKFAYISSHDLKSPLRAIDNLSKWIEQDSKDTLSEDSKKDMATLRSRVKRMNTLVEDLLQYSRIGYKKYDSEEVDLNQLLQEITEMLDIPQGFDIKIKTSMPAFTTTLPPLKQIFMNLIGNAIKHHDNPIQGKVTISSQDLGKFYEFSVSDNGPGIPKEFHKEAFYMFQTLQPRDETEGSGMGLAFIDKIVRVHGGTVSLESEEGQGAIFRFCWPKKIEREENT